jgi:hypothetical protein
LFPAGMPLDADVIRLKSGQVIEGTSSPGAKPGTLEIRRGDGSVVVVDRKEIDKIEKKISPSEELDARLAAIPRGEVDPLVDLLTWARDKGLYSRVKLIARKILDIDTNNELARRELGFVVFENKWVLESELKKRKGLVRFQDEWMTQAEKERRLGEGARKDIEELLDLVGSDNSYVQEFSIRKILARKDAAAREVFLAHLRDSREVVRMVALRGLMDFPAKDAGSAEAKAQAALLHEMALTDDSDNVLKVLHVALAKCNPSENFRLALEVIRSSGQDASDEKKRKRAGDILYYTLRKAYVPDLCRALTSPDGKVKHKEVLDVLQRALKGDFRYDAAAWLRFWSQHQAEFSDS